MTPRCATSTALLLILSSTYGIALWASSFCRGGQVLGRELREIPSKLRRLESTLQESAMCEAFQGTDVLDEPTAFLQTKTYVQKRVEAFGPDDSVAFLQTKASLQKKAQVAEEPKGLDVSVPTFEEPWAKYWSKCVQSAASYNPGRVGPDKLPWGEAMQKQASSANVTISIFSSQFHTTERLWTLQNIIADPLTAVNRLPTQHTDDEMLKLYSETNSRIHELDAKLQAMKASLVKKGAHPPAQHVLASVHFADLHNRMLALLGQPLWPEDVEFVQKHWLKWLKHYASDYSKLFESDMNAGAFHTFCAKQEVADIQEQLQKAKSKY